MRRQPNLLFLFTDEQAATTMAAYGNRLIETPNLNKLASDSIVFENAYVTQPVCTPSRSSILTGLYPHTTGCTENNLPLKRETPCLPELGDFAGYRTAYYGKWHLGDEVFAQHGFDQWRSIEDGYRKYYSEGRGLNRHSTYHDYLVDSGFEPNTTWPDGFRAFTRGFCASLPEEYGKPAYLAHESSRFIRENRDHPFILYVNFLEPHMPFFGPRDDQYDPQRVPLPANFHHELTEDLPLKSRLFQRGYYERGHGRFPLKTEGDWRRLIANYWGLVSLVDTHVGTILDTLENYGLTDDTIIVFTSDHGDMMGSHRLLAKCTMFEEAVRVPLLLRIPGIERSDQSVKDPVGQIDLVPTLLEAMGQAIPSGLEGHSWVSYLEGKTELAEKNVFIEWNGYNNGFGDILGSTNSLDCWREMVSEDVILGALGDPMRTIITPDKWKYTFSIRGEDQLYNLRTDPYEIANLANEPQYDDLVKELRSEIVRWQKRTGDAVRSQR